MSPDDTYFEELQKVETLHELAEALRGLALLPRATRQRVAAASGLPSALPALELMAQAVEESA